MIHRRAVLRALIFLAPSAVGAQTTIHVAAGGNLQTALNTAACGDTITLEAAATFTGNFTLPATSCTGGQVIMVRSVNSGSLPDTLAYVDPAVSGANMAIVRSNNATPALLADPGDKDWTFVGIIFESGHTLNSSGLDIVRICDGTANNAATICDNFTFDRCAFRTAASSFAHRGLQFHGKNIDITRSHFSGIRSAGNESHALSTWNSPGPILVRGNYIAAGSIGMLVGGAVPGISGLVNSDITVDRNYFTRDTSWHFVSGYAIKNIFELKNAQRVTITGNIFEHNWPDGQSGFTIVFTVRANGNGAPQSTIRDVTFQNNVIRHVGAAFNILGLDNQTAGCNPSPCESTVMNNVVIHNNLIWDLDKQDWGWPDGVTGAVGHMFQIDGSPQNLHITNNTVCSADSGNIITAAGGQAAGFKFQYNIVRKDITPTESYGVIGTGFAEGNATLAQFFPNVATFPTTIFADNVLAGATASVYNNWPTNVFPSLATLEADFVNVGTGNCRLVGGSAFAGKGADLDAIDAAIAGIPAAPAGSKRRPPRLKRR
jgi:hypothetical protein